MDLLGLFRTREERIRRMGERKDIRGLAKALRFEDASLREEAVQALRRLPASEAAPLLTQAARDGHPRVRTAALMALKSDPTPNTIPIFLDALGDQEDRVREAALESLAAITERGTRIETRDPRAPSLLLLSILQNSQRSTRAMAGRVLDALGWTPASTEERVLLAVARGKYEDISPDRDAAVASALALHKSGKLSDAECFELLRHLPTAEAVAYLCAAKAWQAVAQIRSADNRFDELIHDQAVQPLLKHLEAHDLFDEKAVEALISIGHPTATALLKKALDRGYYEYSSSLQADLSRFVEAHRDLWGPPETLTCNLCKQQRPAREMQSVVEKRRKRMWFCKEKCWDNRGRLIGSRLGEGCPYWQDGVCRTGSGRPNHCSLELSSYRECFVYRSKTEGPHVLIEGLPGAWR